MSTKPTSRGHKSDEELNGKKAASTDWSSVIGRHSMMLALEPRFMFDASVGDVAAEADANVSGDADAGGEGDGQDGDGGESHDDGGGFGDGGDGDTDGYQPLTAFGSFQTFDVGILADEDEADPRAPQITVGALGENPDTYTFNVIENKTDILFPQIEIGNPVDGPNELTVTISVEHGTLSFVRQVDGIDIVGGNLWWDSTSSTFTLKGDPAQMSDALSNLQYTPTEYYSGSDAISITVGYELYTNSAGGSSATAPGSFTATIDIDIEDVNNPAAIDIDRTTDITIAEDELGDVIGISIIDKDATNEKGDTITVELTVGKGKLYYDDPLDLCKEVTSEGRTYVFTGARDDINDLLATLQYQGDQDEFGTDRLTITAWDEYWSAESDPDGLLKATDWVDIRVTPVPDAPEIDFITAPLTAEALENNGDGVVLSNGMFGITDVDTSPALLMIEIQSLPSTGVLYRKNSDGTWQRLAANARFSVEDLNSGNIKYVHSSTNTKVRDDVATDGFYSTDGFTFIVTDGTGNYVTYDGDVADRPESVVGTKEMEGVDAAVVAFTINLKPVNDPAAIVAGGTDCRTESSGVEGEDETKTLAVYEGEDWAIIKLSVTDADQAPNVSHKIYITSLPDSRDGYLYYGDHRLTGADLVLVDGYTYEGGEPVYGFLISQDDIDAGLLTFHHSGIDGADAGQAAGSGSTRDTSFGVTVVDDGGGTRTEKVYDETTLDIIVYPNNDNPEFHDDITIGAGNVVGDAEITDTSGSHWWMNKFTVADGFNVVDPDSPPTSITYTIEGLPDKFAIYFDNGDGTYRQLNAGDTFTQQDIINGSIVYRYTGGYGEVIDEGHPDYEKYPPRYNAEKDIYENCSYHDGKSQLTFTVTDGSLTAWARDDNGVVHEEGLTGGIGNWGNDGGTWTLEDFKVDLVVDFHNYPGGDGPTVIEAGNYGVDARSETPVVGYEDGRITLTDDNIKSFLTYTVTTNGENSEDKADQEGGIVYRLMSLPEYGSLCKNNVAMTKLESFTQQDILDGIITYVHGGGEEFSDSFSVTVAYGTYIFNATAGHPEGAPLTVGINLSPVNDRPVAGGELTVKEGVESGQINKGGFDENGVLIRLTDIYSDADGGGTVQPGYDLTADAGDGASFAAVNENVKVVITALPEHGSLEVYRDGGEGVWEWVGVTLTDAALVSSDANWDGLTGLGTVLTASDFANSHVRYVHDGDDAGGFADSFKIIVNDGKGINSSGEALQSTGTTQVKNGEGEYEEVPTATGSHASSISNEGTVRIAITQVNDYPVLQESDDFHTPEGGNHDPAKAKPTDYQSGEVGTIIESKYFQYLDSDHTNKQLQYTIDSKVANGTLYKRDSVDSDWYALGNTSVFTQADIDNGNIKYVHDGSETSTDSFTYTIRDPEGATITAQFAINVDPTNDAPKVVVPDLSKESNAGVYLDPEGLFLSSVAGKQLYNGGNAVFQISDIDYTNDGASIDGRLITVKVTAVTQDYSSLGGGIQAKTEWGVFTYTAADPDLAGGGSVTGKGQNGGTLIITGTLAEVNAILATLTYKAEGSDAETMDLNAAVKITVSVDDKGNGDVDNRNLYKLGAEGGVTLYVSTRNNDPYFDDHYKNPPVEGTANHGQLFTVTMNEDANKVAIEDNAKHALRLVDLDAFSRNVNTITLTVSHGTLNLSTPLEPLAGGNNSRTITLRGTLAELNAALAGMTYSPDANWNGVDTLQIVYKDGNAIQNGDSGAAGQWGTGTDGQKGFEASVALYVYPVNDAPTLDTPAEIIVVDTASSVVISHEGKFIQVGDDNDVGFSTSTKANWIYNNNEWDVVGNRPLSQWENDIIEVTISAASQTAGTTGNGTLTVDDTLHAAVIASGYNTSVLVLRGTVDAVNDALETLTYHIPGSSTDQSTELTITVNDLGNGATKGDADPLLPGSGRSDATKAETVEKKILVIVSDKNDAPEIGGVGAVAVDEDKSHKFVDTQTGDAQITVFDVDAAELPLKMTLEVGHGTLTVTNNTGVYGVFEITGNNSGKITITGPQEYLNIFLKTLEYKPDANYNGTDELVITVDDQGNSYVEKPGTEGDPNYGPKTATKTVGIVVNPVNDAPLVTGGPTKAMTEVSEDVSGGYKTDGASAADYHNPGQTVDSLFGASFLDTNDVKDVKGNNVGNTADTFAGVAIVGYAADANKGEWQYWNGSGWTGINSVNAITGAVYLDASTAIRFQPVADYNGAAPALKVVLVENNTNALEDPGATPPSNGASVDATYTETGIFSKTQLTLNINVGKVNDAPTIDGKATPAEMVVNEDQAYKNDNTDGKSVSELFGDRYRDTPDEKGAAGKDAFAGVLIVGNDTPAEAGTWQYWNGSAWTDIDAAAYSDTNALFLTAATNIRFLPAANYNNNDSTLHSLTVRFVETDANADSGMIVPATNRVITTDLVFGGTSIYSSDTTTVTIRINPVNDAPVVKVDDATKAMTPVDEDISGGLKPGETVTTDRDNYVNAGEKVLDLFYDDFFSDKNDADRHNASDTFAGVAVVVNGSNIADGAWEYWTGTEWKAVGACSRTSAVYLDADTYVRFNPGTDFNGDAPDLQVVLVENNTNAAETPGTIPPATNGKTGVDATYTATGIFSEKTIALTMVVNAVNDAPVVEADSAKDLPTIISWPGYKQPGTAVSDLFGEYYTDPKDNVPVSGHISSDEFAGVVIIGNGANAADGVWQYSLDNGDTWTDIPANLGETNGLYLSASAEIRFNPVVDTRSAPGGLTAVVVETSKPGDDTQQTLPTTDPEGKVDVSVRGGTSLYSENTVALNITVSEPNHAPTIKEKDVPVNMEMVEDHQATDSGQTVDSLFADRFADAAADVEKAAEFKFEPDAFYGVVITGNDANPDTEGMWYYSTDDGANWTAVPTSEDGNNGDSLSDTNGLFLAGGAKLKFVPAEEHYNGTPTSGLTVRFVETITNGDSIPGTVQPGNGDYVNVDTGSRAGYTQFSEDTVKLQITVKPENDAPIVVDGTTRLPVADATTEMPSIDEDISDGLESGAPQPYGPDSYVNSGKTVNDLFGGFFSDRNDEGQTGAEDVIAGVAIVDYTPDSNKGSWEYWDGSAWAAIGDCAVDNALYLSAGTAIRFNPATDFNGAVPELKVVLVENNTNAAETPGTQPPATNWQVGVDATYTATGIFSKAMITLTMSVKAVNDAPVVEAGNTEKIDTIVSWPDYDEWSGKTVESLFDRYYDDPNDDKSVSSHVNTDKFAGVVLIGNAADSATEGVWEYSLDGGENWTAVSTGLDDANGLYLPKDAQIRFCPVENTTGEPGALTAVLVETSGENDDTPQTLPTTAVPVNVSGSNRGGTTIYSENTVGLTVKVSTPNQAPVADPTPVTRDIYEDATGSSYEYTVSSLFGDRYTDPNDAGKAWLGADSLAGVVIVGNAAVSTEGVWQYWDGSDWVAISVDVSESEGLYLDATAKIRFVPETHYNGVPGGLTVVLAETVNEDSVPGAELPENGATGVDVSKSGAADYSKRGGYTQYGDATVGFNVTVRPVNDAPVIKDSFGGATLGTINEDQAYTDTVDDGKTVGDIFAGGFSDPNDDGRANGADGFAGVVIVENAADPDTEGKWQYWDANENEWVDIPSSNDADPANDLDDAKALFLAKDAQIRFLPVADYNGTPTSLVARLVETDQAGENKDSPDIVPADTGKSVNASVNGGTSIFSGATTTIGVKVAAVNDAPQVAAGKDSVAFDPILAIPDPDNPGETVGHSGQTVADVFGDSYADTKDTKDVSGFYDKDDSATVDSLAGVVIIGNDADPAEGVWQYWDAARDNGDGTHGAWIDIPGDYDAIDNVAGVGEAQGLYLAKEVEIRFQPKEGFTGTPAGTGLTVVLVETSNADNGGATVPDNFDTVDVGGANRGGTTIYSDAAVTANISVYPPNIAPVVKEPAVPVQREITEDSASSYENGYTISDLFAGKFDDTAETGKVDAGLIDAFDSLAGVVIVKNTADAATQGTWQYSTDGGENWNNVGSVSEGSGLYLTVDADNMLRFVPVANYNGTPPALEVALVETVANGDSLVGMELPANGDDAVDVGGGKRGGATPYSGDNAKLEIVVKPVNDAPVIEDTFEGATLTEINEDQGAAYANDASDGDTVEDIFTGAFDDPNDADRANGGDGFAGVVIVENDADPDTEGKWQYWDGTDWLDIPSSNDADAANDLTDAKALFLAKDAKIRFLPVGDYNGTPASLVVRLVETDQAGVNKDSPNTVPTVTGESVNASVNGGTSIFSGTTTTIGVKVAAVNDAPQVMDSGEDVVFPGISNTGHEQVGRTVESLFGGRYADADDTTDLSSYYDPIGDPSSADSFAGIVIVGNAADPAEGVWQYWDTAANGGKGGWIDIPTNYVAVTNEDGVAESQGLYLAAGVKIRFQPDDGFTTGNPGKLTVVLVETTNADNGGRTVPENFGTVDVSGTNRGGTTIYSGDTVRMKIYVGEVNNAPTLADGDPVELTIDEDVENPPEYTIDQLFGGKYKDSADEYKYAGNDLDADEFDGVVIIRNEVDPLTEGAWQYWDAEADDGNGGQGAWIDIPTGADSDSLGETSGLFLSATAKIRFVPVSDYHGTPPSLEVVLAETIDNGDAAVGTIQAENGGRVDVGGANRGGATQYSRDAVTLTLTVKPVNDAPEIQDSFKGATLTEINEDRGAAYANDDSDGDTVEDIFAGAFDDPNDADRANGGDAFAGVVIVENAADPATEGKWQYWDAVEKEWVDIPSSNDADQANDLTDANALFLAKDAKIRFLPVGNYNGTPTSLVARLVETDQAGENKDSPNTVPTVTGESVNASTNGGTSIFSGTTTTIGVKVAAVNDAPTLEGAPGTLDPVISFADEHDLLGNGHTVADLFGGMYRDIADSASPSTSGGDVFAGVVIVGITSDAATEGVWEYSTDGKIWTSIDATLIGESTGLYLASGTSLRFNPVDGYSGNSGNLTVVLAETNTNNDVTSTTDTFTTGETVDAGAANRGGTSLLSDGKATVNLTVRSPNTAPKVDGGTDVTLAPVDEGGVSEVRTVDDLFGTLFDDSADNGKVWVSKDDFAGVVITDYTRDASKGEWQYSTDGVNWTVIESCAETGGLYLESGTSLQFVPAPDYNGEAPKLTVILAETVNDDSLPGTALPEHGATVNTTERGGITPYGDEAITLGVSIKAVNAAPSINNGGADITLPAIDEDVLYADGDGHLIGDLFGDMFDDSGDTIGDNGSDSLAGIVIVENTADASTQGVWKYWDASLDGGAGGWATIPSGTLGDSHALFLAADADTRIRFEPVADYNGTPPSLVVRLVETDDNADSTTARVPAATGEYANASANGGTSVYSADTIRIDITVNAVNDAPEANAPSVALDTIVSFPEETGGAGKTVNELFGGIYTDPSDTKAVSASGGDGFTGVVIVANACDADTEGVWEYSLDGGRSWKAVGPVDASSGLFLEGDAQLRFNPVYGYGGTPGGLAVVLTESDANGDASISGLPASGGTVNAAVRGDATIFSADTVDLGIEIRSPNSAPEASDTSASLTAIDEDAANNPGDRIGDLFGTLFDDSMDSGKNWVAEDSLAGVVIVGNPAVGYEGGSYQYSVDGGKTWTDIGACGENNGLYLDADAIIRFNPVADYNGEPPRLSVILVETVNADSPSGAAVPDNTAIVDVAGGNRGGMTPFGDRIIELGVTVNAVDDPPRAEDDFYEIIVTQERAGSVGGNIMENDSHADEGVAFGVDASRTAAGKYGTLKVSPDGDFSYTVNPGASGLANLQPGDIVYDKITYTLVDEHGYTDTAEVVIKIVYRPNDEYTPRDEPKNTGDADHIEEERPNSSRDQNLSDPPVVNNVNDSSTWSDSQVSTSNDRFHDEVGVSNKFPSLCWQIGEVSPEDWTLTAGVDEKVVKAGEKQDMGLPKELFIHSNPEEKLEYTAMMADGTPLLEWIEFDPDTFALTCTPPGDVKGSVEVVIRGQDTRGNKADALVTLKVNEEEAEDVFATDDENADDAESALNTGDDPDSAEGEDDASNEKAEIPVPEDLAELRRMLLDGVAPEELAPDTSGTHPGLRHQIAETGSGGLLADARVLLNSLMHES